MNDDELLLEKRLGELADRAYNSGIYTSSEFLTIAQQDTLARVMSHRAHIPCELFGGHPASERRIAYFGSEELCGYEQTPPVRCVCARAKSAKFAGELSHRDYLGALMGLGIRRETVGDIFIEEKSAYIFCLDTIAQYIADNLLEAGRTTLVRSVCDGFPEGLTVRTQPVSVNVASERIDAVIGAVLNISRTAASSLLAAKRVYVNSRQCLSGSHTLKDGDIVSVRGSGRFKYLGPVKETKKGRLFIAAEKYI